MPKRSSTPPETPTIEHDDEDAQRRAAAAMLGRLGGLKGGKARAEKLSKKRRSEIAKQAAKKRWEAKQK